MGHKLTSRLLLGWIACCAMLVACDREPRLPSHADSKPLPVAPLPRQTDAANLGATEPSIKLPLDPQAELATEPEIAADSTSHDQETELEYPPIEKHFTIPSQWKRLGASEIWIDREKRQVIVGGHICLRAGALEMFACPQHTKEHESVVATHMPSKFVHAALLAVGARPGTTVQFDPEYTPASGPKVKVSVRWMQDAELKELPAQQMVRDIATGNAMVHDWLFVGSGTWKNPDTGEEEYMGDSGELICVSNFGNATMDLPVESSSAASGLLFEAMTDNIPDRETLVLLVLEPEVLSSRETPSNDQENAAGVDKTDLLKAKSDK